MLHGVLERHFLPTVKNGYVDNEIEYDFLKISFSAEITQPRTKH